MNPTKSLMNWMFWVSYLRDCLNGVLAVSEPRLAGVGGWDFKKRMLSIVVIPIRMPCMIYIPNTCILDSSTVESWSMIRVGRRNPTPLPTMFIAVRIEVATVLYLRKYLRFSF